MTSRTSRSPNPTVELLDRIEQLQDHVKGLEHELVEARRKAEDTGGDTDRARAALVTMFSHLEVRDRTIDDLRQRLDAAGLTGTPRVETPLGEALVGRGLLGHDEHTRAIQALLEARRWPELSGVLAVSRAEVLQTILRERIVLQCGRARCAVPRFTIPVRVPPSRCEICGGEDLPNTMRRLSDTLMLNGWNRLLVLGGGPGEHRLLSELLDERVAVSGISGRAPVVPRDALDTAGCVVLWSGAEPDRPLVESLERALESGVVSPRVSRRPERGLGAMSLALIRDLSD